MPETPTPRLALSVDVRQTPGGVVALESSDDHRVRVHAGGPVQVGCGHQAFVYTRGDIDLVPAGMSDAWHAEQASTSLYLRLSPALLGRAAMELGRDPGRAGLEWRHQLRDPQIEHVAWALEAERAAGHPNGSLYAESLGLALALHLLGRHGAPARSPRGLSTPQLRRVTSYIEEHLDQPLSLVAIAEVAGVSASHLKTLFRRATGLPVHRYVIQRRVERARQLLVRGDLPASQIALAAGFAHQSHMARCLRRALGVTPSALTRSARSS